MTAWFDARWHRAHAVGSMQCPYYVHKAFVHALGSAGREGPHRGERRRRRIRRQGRLPEHDRPARGAPRARRRPPGAGLPMTATKTSSARRSGTHRSSGTARLSIATGTLDRDGRRGRPRRRRLQDALARRAVASHPACGRSVSGAARPRARSGASDDTRRRTARSAASACRRRRSQSNVRWTRRKSRRARPVRDSRAERRRPRAIGCRQARSSTRRPRARECLERAASRTRFQDRWRERRGIGISLYFHGCGFTGSGELKMKSPVTARLPDGRIEILTAMTDMGQGCAIVFPQIAADGCRRRASTTSCSPRPTRGSCRTRGRRSRRGRR